MEAVTKLKGCRVCGSVDLNSVFDAGVQVLTGRFPESTEEEITAGPLQLLQCNPRSGCGLVQLGHSYDLEEMYGESYGYRSGLNQAMVTHLKGKVDRILHEHSLGNGDLVIDIGSNDGTTLNAYPAGKYTLVGVDPSAEKYKRYYREEIERIPDFFSGPVIEQHFPGRKAQVITSFSMFYDLEKPVQFASEVRAVLADTGIWVFEQSYLPAMLKANSFDTICHEHLEYYSMGTVQNILGQAGLRVLDVEFNDVNGGSFSVTACKENAAMEPRSDVIERVLEEENSLGLEDGSAFEQFGQRVEAQRQALMDFLREQEASGNTVCGLGASTKGNVLLQYYGITPELVSSIGEVNPDKYGCFTPGTHIPIVPQDEMLAGKPDYLLVLPWHFREFFVQNAALQSQTLVFPLPNFEIVTPR